VLADLTNACLYYYSYNDTSIRKIDLKRLAAKGIANPVWINAENDFAVKDMTDAMQPLK